MSTQASLLGFSTTTVDAITWTPVYLRYVRRTGGEASLENAGSVTVNLRTVSTDSTTERALLSGESMAFKTDGSRATGWAPEVPIAWAKAASATSTLVVIER